MKTEIIKIIEGGLTGDREKVNNYAKVLANNFLKIGDEVFSNRIINTINNKNKNITNYEEFTSRPVDQESRLDIADIWYPNQEHIDPVLNFYLTKEINAFIDEYNNKDILASNGLSAMSSILLYGSPGNGKTSLAKYIAKSLNKPLVIARFDSLVSSLLGSTSKNIRKLFDYIQKRDCILFLDEFDVVAKARDDSNELGELKRVVNSLLQNIDSLEGNNVIIAATNHHDLLDKAVWRRFDKVFELSKPGGKEIKTYISKLLVDRDTDFMDKPPKLDRLTELFEDLSFSEIKTIIQNTIRKSIVSGDLIIKYAKLVYETYLVEYHIVQNESDIVSYLNRYGVSQDDINKETKLSQRTIRKILNFEDKDE